MWDASSKVLTAQGIPSVCSACSAPLEDVRFVGPADEAIAIIGDCDTCVQITVLWSLY